MWRAGFRRDGQCREATAAAAVSLCARRRIHTSRMAAWAAAASKTTSPTAATSGRGAQGHEVSALERDNSIRVQTIGRDHSRTFSVDHGVFAVHVVPMRQDNYTYLIEDRQSDSVLVVDPSDGARAMQACEDLDLNVAGVLCTHHHDDHVAGVKLLRQSLMGCKVRPPSVVVQCARQGPLGSCIYVTFCLPPSSPLPESYRSSLAVAPFPSLGVCL